MKERDRKVELSVSRHSRYSHYGVDATRQSCVRVSVHRALEHKIMNKY
jgi:hypothetical protein